MAVFDIAFERTEKFEGANVWTKDPKDPGGETWSGISRRANPTWEGWKIIDAVPGKYSGGKIINDRLEVLKRELYKTKYWDVMRLDEVNNQYLANELYDDGVNTGVTRARAKFQALFGVEGDYNISDELLRRANYENI